MAGIRSPDLITTTTPPSITLAANSLVKLDAHNHTGNCPDYVVQPDTLSRPGLHACTELHHIVTMHGV